MGKIIPANPTFATLLAQHLGQAVGDVGQGYFQGQQKRQQQQGTQTLLQQYGITPEQAEVIARTGIEPKDVLQYGHKLAKSQNTDLQNLEGDFNRLDELSDYGRTNLGFKKFQNVVPGSEGYQKAEELDALGLLMADKAFTHLNKGTMSDKKLKLVIDKLAPNSKLRKSQNIARISALRRLFGLPGNASEKEIMAVVNSPNEGNSSPQPNSQRPSIESIWQ